MRQRFDKLYRRRFFLHHYEQYMDPEEIAAAADEVTRLIADYQDLDLQAPPAPTQRRRPLGISFLV
jgi:tubulin epsilon